MDEKRIVAVPINLPPANIFPGSIAHQGGTGVENSKDNNLVHFPHIFSMITGCPENKSGANRFRGFSRTSALAAVATGCGGFADAADGTAFAA